MAADSVEICNSALSKLGANPITAIDSTTKAGKILTNQYNRLRKEVLRAHPWNFAIAYVSLAATVNTPVWDKWTTEFLVPSDVLRVLETDLVDQEPWEIGYNADGNKVIFTNADAVKIKYIKDITNTTRFDVSFDEALSFRIAADIAYAMVQSQSVQQAMFNAYKSFMAEARSFDAQESEPMQQIQADEFINIRG